MRQLFCLVILIFLNMNIKVSAGTLDYNIQQIDSRYFYCGDFELIITNTSSNPVALNCFDGPPFKMTYIVNGKSFPLIHKLDQYANDNGASRAPQARSVAGNGSLGFFVDLSGDFVVQASGKMKLFREFAIGKNGEIQLEPNQTEAFQSKEKMQTIKTIGVHPIIEQNKS